MNRTIVGAGQTIEVRMPSSEEITALRRAKLSPEAARKFVKNCLVSPPLHELTATKPAIVLPLAAQILEIYGLTTTIFQVDEDEMDGALATAFVEAQTKGFQGLSAVQVPLETEPEPLVFIFRQPKEREIEDVQRDEKSVAVQEAFVRRICVHGPLDRVEKAYPGLWVPLAMYVIERNGFDEEFRLGKA